MTLWSVMCAMLPCLLYLLITIPFTFWFSTVFCSSSVLSPNKLLAPKSNWIWLCTTALLKFGVLKNKCESTPDLKRQTGARKEFEKQMWELLYIFSHQNLNLLETGSYGSHFDQWVLWGRNMEVKGNLMINKINNPSYIKMSLSL